MQTAQRAAAPFEDGISKRNFDRLAAYIYDYSGIKMPPSKQTMLEGRLRRRLRATGHASFEAYCNFLFSQGGLEKESIFLIDAVTTNKTDFFREPNHFQFMTQRALPLWSSRSAAAARLEFGLLHRRRALHDRDGARRRLRRPQRHRLEHPGHRPVDGSVADGAARHLSAGNGRSVRRSTCAAAM